ncbi:MAG: DUF5667 domain-containing protein [Gammaproteobacteria bacterium]
MQCLVLPFALLLGSPPAEAGHGLMNAFADIAWLPDAGRTPADADYPLDRAAEAARLAIADDAGRFALLLEFQREKLAEVDAMVRAEHRDAAAVAVAAYVDYLARAAALVDAGDAAVAAQRARTLAGVLLEHRYIMSVNYLDMPRAARGVVGTVIDAASAHYERLVATLPRTFREAQFFREEEVRWSWEVARQADAQGL